MIQIPKTSPQNYLSALVALNIHSPEDTGDWHSCSTLGDKNYPLKHYLFGDGQPCNTNHLLGSIGVIDGTHRLNKMGYFPENTPIWIADHPRACVDYLYYIVIQTGVLGCVMLDEWFPAIEDKERVYKLLDIIEPKLNNQEREILQRWKQRNPIAE